MGKEPTSGSMARSTLVNISMKSRKDMESFTGMTGEFTEDLGRVGSNTGMAISPTLPVKRRTENGIWASSRDGCVVLNHPQSEEDTKFMGRDISNQRRF